MGFAGWQLLLTKRQGETAFEDQLSSQYREIFRRLPIDAVLGDELSDERISEELPNFLHYIDRCNEQAYLRKQELVRENTWKEWEEGILENLQRPAFARAWEILPDERQAVSMNCAWYHPRGFPQTKSSEDDPFPVSIMNPKDRQYFEATIQQLRDIMLAHRTDLAVLGDLRVELEHRRSRGARQLLREIEALVSGEVPRPTRPPRAAKPEDQTTMFDREDKNEG